ncbi:MAG: SDR family NAD(P)-dependent oxidoreductase, partial [Actinomycetota bacterium]
MHAAGCNVVITSTTSRVHERVAELKAIGGSGDVLGVAGDLTREADVDALVSRACKEFEHVDVLVNNAGMVTVGNELFNASLAETTLQQWNESLARNLTTCFLVTRRALAAMPDGGRIVNVASTTGALQAGLG